MTPLLIFLPMMFWGFLKEGGTSLLGLRRAYPLRHAIDIGQALIFYCGLFPSVIYKLMPLSTVITEECKLLETGAIGAGCAQACKEMQFFQGVMAVLNFFMLVIDIVRYNVGAPPEE